MKMTAMHLKHTGLLYAAE